MMKILKNTVLYKKILFILNKISLQLIDIKDGVTIHLVIRAPKSETSASASASATPPRTQPEVIIENFVKLYCHENVLVLSKKILLIFSRKDLTKIIIMLKSIDLDVSNSKIL